ncbi:hypothetical protein GO495_31595 [Chitinophaga oryziterrae]|uniref:DUF6603 domain-containing protein n=1 Tax=Chitinophaga oryziterrae TaxID=1031224 RepID=A0A6N8JIW5_9BACT|nr:DUF6603 domain-containing protein [Chitinophaga oryziterrae]MVT45175.1 hypothetical protein [Chitinophaga oryziterrae]
MAGKDTIVRIATSLAKALGGGASFFDDFSTQSLGLKLPDAVLQTSAVTSAQKQGSFAANALTKAATDLETAVAADDTAAIIKAIFDLGQNLVAYFSAIGNLVSAVSGSINAGTIPDSNDRAAATALIAILGKKIADGIIISAIEGSVPQVMFGLKILGLAEWQFTPADTGNNLSNAYVKKGLYLERIKGLINDPAKHFKDYVKWGDPSFDPTNSFNTLLDFFDAEDAVVVGVVDGDPYFQYGNFRVRRLSGGLQFEFKLSFTESVGARINLNDQWGIGFSAHFGLDGQIALKVAPPLNFELTPPGADVSGDIKLFLDRNESARPFDIIGNNGLINLSATNVAAGVGLSASWDIGKHAAIVEPMIFAEITGATLRIGSADGDGFIAKLLASADIEGNFDLGLEWLASKGLRVKASGGIEIALPIHKQLGPLEIDTIYLALKILTDGTLSLEASAGFKAMLGPLSAAVERIGAKIDFSFSDSNSDKFGMFNVTPGFKPPNGVGLAVDAGVVKGGGYLFLDYDKGEYAGALELTFSEIVSLKAIGIINTKMPDGTPGFSLLIIISAEFGTGIQLGFGFVLLGVGGLLGLNRRMNLQPLAEGVRSGAVNGIMFPTNIVENAPRIISDLRTFFPVEEGKFLIGPMAKLGWGTPALVTVSLGIIIEIPGNIAILGILKIALPTDEAAILKLQINFIGAIEFDKSRLWFFASLYDSRILFITLEGEMGLLVAWGSDGNFVVSVGGFHPAFNPPPLPFPSPARLSLNVLNEDWGRIRVMAYFAVTSNTVQFGARAELYFGFSALNIDGHIAFDALFQFSPFYFIISLSASLSVKVFGIGLLSVRVEMSLEGPTPYRAKGTGSISLLFFDVDVDFDFTWGETQNTVLPPIAVMPLLKAEFDKLVNWKAQLPAGNNILVSLRTIDAAAELVLHPVGTLQVSQRYVPLGLTLNKVGTQKPSDATIFTVSATGLNKKNDVQEAFAMAQFQDMDNATKLSRPSFEKENGGLELSVAGHSVASGKAVKRIVRYELIVIDTNYKRFLRRFFNFFSGALFNHFLKGNAVAKSSLSMKSSKQLQPFDEKVQVVQGGYAVASVMNNKAVATFASEAQAREYMQQQSANLQETLHVIPQHELNTAA